MRNLSKILLRVGILLIEQEYRIFLKLKMIIRMHETVHDKNISRPKYFQPNLID